MLYTLCNRTGQTNHSGGREYIPHTSGMEGKDMMKDIRKYKGKKIEKKIFPCSTGWGKEWVVDGVSYDTLSAAKKEIDKVINAIHKT